MSTNSALMKKNNRFLLLQRIREGEISRAELARKTGLSRASVTLITDELIREGLVIEGESLKTANGRRPTLLRLCKDAFHAIGLDFCRDGIYVCVTDFTMQPILCDFIPKDTEIEDALCKIEGIAKRAQLRNRILGVGISAPGPLDVPSQRILTPSEMERWHGFSMQTIAARLGLPICLEKDTNALAIAEKYALRETRDFLVLLADHGLGSALIHKGRIFASAGGFGCELGHTVIAPGGPLCSCGRRGCAELSVSIPTFLKKAACEGCNKSWEALTDDALAENADCVRLLSDYADILGEVCLNAVNLFEPAQIVLEGRLSYAHPFLAPRIEKKLHTQAFTESGRRVRVVQSLLPPPARAIAAASLVLERYFMGEE
ncbi:MAG: ROK family transcriptional regulator [Ruminococcaceae bacterium]|nr:ROK family transcriptional regulator [Oscillospiraceae bacterium]